LVASPRANSRRTSAVHAQDIASERTKDQGPGTKDLGARTTERTQQEEFRAAGASGGKRMTGRVFIVTAFRGRVTQKLGHAELCLSKEDWGEEGGRTLGLWVLGGTSPGPRTGLT